MTLHALQETPAQPEARIIGDDLFADGLTITDSEFVANAAELNDDQARGKVVQRALDVGVIATGAVGVGQRIRHLEDVAKTIDESINSSVTEATTQLGKEVSRITSPEDGVLTEAVKRELTKLVDTLDKEFDADSKASVLGKLANLVEKTVIDNAEAIRREVGRLVDPSNPDGPGGRLRAELISEVKPILEAVHKVGEAVNLTKAVAEEAEKGTGKGTSFEELVGEVLEAISLSSGDTVDHVQNAKGVTGAKTGDHTITVTDGTNTGRIVVEDKDRRAFTTSKARTELDEAAANRESGAGIMVFSSTEPKATAGIPFRKLCAGRYVVVYDKDQSDPTALRLAVAASRVDVLIPTGNGDEVDVDEISSLVEAAANYLGKITTIKANLGTARRAIDTAGTSLGDLETDLNNKLAEINDLIHT